MEHILESEMAFYAFDPTAVPESRRKAIESHIADCAACRTTYDFFAVAEEDLSDVEVWERTMGSATRESLMVHAARIAEEDKEAAKLLKPLFEVPARVAWGSLYRQKKFLNGGVVRQLNARALALRESEPLEALTFAEAAVAIAEALPDDTYRANAIYELRGKAWEHCAGAQMFLGEFSAAHDSLKRAERAYTHLAAPAFGLAAVALTRASVYYCQQQFADAERFAEQAESAYGHLGDDERRMRALLVRGGIRFELCDLAGATRLFRLILDYAESTNNARWMARALNAIGNCESDRGNLGEASLHFQRALAVLRETGFANERISAEWGFARVLLRAGKRHEAIRRLRDAAAEFESRGMMTDAALASLDIADGLLALGQPQQIVSLAARMFRIFTDAGMLTGALTALAYIQEAAVAKTLTAEDVQAVRVYLRRAQRQPELLFLPPRENR